MPARPCSLSVSYMFQRALLSDVAAEPACTVLADLSTLTLILAACVTVIALYQYIQNWHTGCWYPVAHALFRGPPAT